MVGVAVKVTDIPSHTGFAEAAMAILTGSAVLAAIVIGLERTGFVPLIQVALEVSWQVIMSPFAGEQENVGLFVPAGIPFFFHRYTGEDPPFVINAVNVTELPWQNGLDEAVMIILAGRAVLTTIVMGLDIAGLP